MKPNWRLPGIAVPVGGALTLLALARGNEHD
jgi:hypothetical protein